MQLWLKLLLSYLAIICATVLISIGGISGAQNVRDSFHKVNKEVIPHLLVLKDLRYAGLRIVSSSMEYAFISSMQAAGGEGKEAVEAKEEEVRLLAQGRASFLSSLALCGRILVHGTDGNPDEMQRNGQALLKASRDYLAVVDARGSASELIGSKEAFEKAENAFLKSVNVAHDREMADLDRHVSATFKSVSNAIASAVVLSVIALGAALLLSVAISYNVSRRIRTLKDAAAAVAAGDRNVVVPVTERDEITAVSVSFNTMVQRLRAFEEELDSANSYLDSIIATMPEALTVVSRDGVILDVNRATEEVFGFAKRDLVGRDFAGLFVEPAQGGDFISAVLRQEGLVEREASLLTEDGRAIHVNLSATMLELKEGKRDRFLCLSHDITQRKQAEREVHNLAYFDQLTGLANRTLFYDRCSQALARARRNGEMFAILFFDLDHFKDVNDTMGHQAGDQLLQLVVRRFQGILRASDTFARLGGDEFAVLCCQVPEPDGASKLAQKLLTLAKQPFDVDNRQVYTGASIGIVLFPEDGGDIQTLLKHGDLAMYAAKSAGGNRYQFFSKGLNQKAQERASIETALRDALRNDRLTLHYQPQLHLGEGRVIALEALARWHDEGLGTVPPATFIPIAEQTGLIHELGASVLRKACVQCKKWHDKGYPVIISVNVSIKQMMQEGFSEMVVGTLLEVGLEPRYLDLELTESMLMEKAAESVALLRMFKSLGVQISIDDFGTGYSSLSYLKNFSVDRIKIDQSFVRDITVRDDAVGIVKAIVAIGHSMGLKVIAEGVETQEEEQKLLTCRCDQVQGYLYAKPMPSAEVDAYLADAFVTARAGGEPGL
ncbi:EAL domain-containing protein [Geomonas subterranea]|uniref:EAL domain-containing protein n=1 Tax=Geomonas subterranea TaxID=2847989 RepID=A0ABX8LMA0_9BACT|nr:EAL domain-containing protein [Geomonas subterranea]QXE92614.1 EAL domain-containing protein [Geomonas subterranea]QXM09287.1 EAL domain-containing protein [Geomonas subterranea]